MNGGLKVIEGVMQAQAHVHFLTREGKSYTNIFEALHDAFLVFMNATF